VERLGNGSGCGKPKNAQRGWLAALLANSQAQQRTPGTGEVPGPAVEVVANQGALGQAFLSPLFLKEFVDEV